VLRRLKNTTVGLMLFAGFTLINYLSSTDSLYLISKDVQGFFLRYKYLFYGAILLTYIIQQLLRDLPKPVDISNAHELQPIIRNYLEYALKGYSKLLVSMGIGIPAVRMNVMLKTRHQSFRNGKLRIIFSLGYVIGKDRKNKEIIKFVEPSYSSDEAAELWKRGQGACGAAWEKGDLTVYDTFNSKYQSPKESLSKHQKEITQDINSILSIPLWLHGKVIGVLNIDSAKNITETKFDDPEVYKMLDDYVDSLAKICAIFNDGIKL
jgi:hypothetical protein